jgi:hypothetical protein
LVELCQCTRSDRTTAMQPLLTQLLDLPGLDVEDYPDRGGDLILEVEAHGACATCFGVAQRGMIFGFIQHFLENAFEFILRGDRQQASCTHPFWFHTSYISPEVGTILDKPFQTFLEVGQLLQGCWFNRFNGEQGN